MKSNLKNIATELGYLNEQESPDRDTSKDTTSGEFNVDVPVQNEMEKVNIKYGHATGPIDDVTISWGNESYNVDFKFSETVGNAEAYDEFDIDLYVAKSKDDKYIFEVEVEVIPREFSGDGGTINNDESAVRWDSLNITLNDDESDEEGKPFGFDDIPDDLKEHFKKLAGIVK